MSGRQVHRLTVLAPLVAALIGGVWSVSQTPPQDELATADAAERSGDYEAAARLYQKFLSGEGPSSLSRAVIEARTRLATTYYLLHRYDESLKALEPLPFGAGDGSAAHATPSKESTPPPTSAAAAIPAQAWLVRGLDYIELNQLPQAIRSLDQALVLKPDSGTARLALGDALARSGRLEEAADDYREQLRRTPEVGDAWYKLGLVYDQLAQEITADLAVKRPADVLALQLSAEQLSHRGDYWGAAQALFRALQPSRPSADQADAQRAAIQYPIISSSEKSAFQPGLHEDFGTAILQLGYPSAAREEFQTELAQDPESLPALLGMEEVEALRSNWESALDALARLMVLHPKGLARRLESPPPAPLSEASAPGRMALPARLAESPAGKLWNAWLAKKGLKSLSQPDVARTQCSAVPSGEQLKPGYWLSEACYAELRAELRSRRSRSKADEIKLIEAEYRLENYQQARDLARSLRRSEPDDSLVAYWLAQSDSALAGLCFDKLAALNSDSARVHQVLARYYSERQQLTPARNEYEAALRLAPDLPDLHLGLGTVYWQGGDWSTAEVELRKTLQLSPGSAVACYELGDSYIQQHDWQQAVDYLRRALADPAVQRRARLDLAKAESELGQDGAAIADLSALAADDRNGEVHYRLAMLYRKTGEAAKAQETLAASEALRSASAQLDRQKLEALEQERERLQQVEPARQSQ